MLGQMAGASVNDILMQNLVYETYRLYK